MREKISCHYSEQKPMGRPRKRQFIEAIPDDPISTQIQEPETQALQFSDNLDAFNGDSLAQPTYMAFPQQHGTFPDVASELGKSIENGHVVWHFGDHQFMSGLPIDFGETDLGSQSSSVPPLASNSASSFGDSDSSLAQSAVGPCNCLASMYLSLAALQQFPTDIVLALRTVRAAAATAAQSIWCHSCGSVVLETTTPPIESFQNTMLLGTILPIIANGYGRLLKMIDDETDFAIATGQTKVFKFKDYGGLFVQEESMPEYTGCCDQNLSKNDVDMSPAQWRTTLRGLLRVDIYGHEQGTFKHKGLKDLVAEMEYRQRIRHDLMDAQEAAGTLPTHVLGHGLFTNQKEKCLGEKTRGCLEILKIAKIAIDNLVIA